MTSRDRIALTVVVFVALLAAYWFLLLSPRREEASREKAKVEAVQKRLDGAQRLLNASIAAKTSYAANYTAVARLGKAVPPDDDVLSLVYQLDKSAKSTGADFRSIKLIPGTPGTAAAAAAAAPPAAGQPGQPAQPGGQGAQPQPAAPGANPATPAANATPAADPTGTPAAPAAPTQAATAALPPGAVVGPAGLGILPFSFQFQGNFFKLANFFGQVHRYVAFSEAKHRLSVSGRLLMIDGVGVTFSELGYPNMETRISASSYLLPPTEGLTNGATPSAPPQGGARAVSNPGPGVPTTPATSVAP